MNSKNIARNDQGPESEAFAHLLELINKTQVAMLTTVESENSLRSRPMMTQQADSSGVLWFFTNDHDEKSKELDADPRVNVSYSKVEDQSYVSVSGLAEIVHDKAKKKELWKPIYKAWFPDGVDDPHVSLLKVYIEKGEFWDAPASTFVQVVGFAKAVLTGKSYQASRDEHDQINLVSSPL